MRPAKGWRVDRRTFLGALTGSLLTAPLAAEAQQPGRTPRIGVLANRSPLWDAFRDGLRELGYVEGQTVALEYRWAEGNDQRLPGMAAELVKLKVDVIMTWGTPAALAAKNATRTIPIVMAASGDPVGTGLIASLARPGGNVTGLSALNPGLESKRLELMKELVPKLSRVAVLWNPANTLHEGLLKEAHKAAGVLSVRLEPIRAQTVSDFDSVFAELARSRPDAMIVEPDVFYVAHRRRIADFAARSRIPAVYTHGDFADVDGLAIYGANYQDLFRRSSVYVDKILKGARVESLPVEQATKFDLILNVKTAKALGLTIPPSLLQRADQVIE
jgi:putative ABC transport system substrate-binding protein